MGVSLFAVMFVMLFIYRRIITAGSYVTITGKAFRPRVIDVGPAALAAVRDLRVLSVLQRRAAAAHACSMPRSRSISTAFPPLSNFTLEHFRKAFTMNAARTALGNSLLLALWHRDARRAADGADLLDHLPLAAARARA